MTFRQFIDMAERFGEWETIRNARNVMQKTCSSYHKAEINANKAGRLIEGDWLHKLRSEAVADAEYANNVLGVNEQ